MRKEWCQKRQNDATPTQMYYAKKGIITEEMEYVAKIEKLQATQIRDLVASGKLIIPSNINHHHLIPMAIGRAVTCKINANIGSSAIISNINEEIEKLNVCLKYGADTVMEIGRAHV